MPSTDIERTSAASPQARARNESQISRVAVPAADPTAAVRVGRYEISHLIGSGGMATVHLGRLIGAAGFVRVVAIKRLLPHYAHNAEFQQLLENEGRLAARIQHPNVVATHDVVAGEGELLLIMDYVPGASLDILMSSVRRREGRVPLLIALAIVCDALHGLHAAHEAKDRHGRRLDIVHRDISPHNLLVGTDGVSRVLDFGIAKAANSVTSTTAGTVRGKLSYMAPEQLREQKLYRRTDVYAVGIVLWELLTGRRMHDSETSNGRSFANIPAPSTLSPVPKTLDEIVMRALKEEPSQRFATALEMASQIEALFTPASRAEVGTWLRREAQKELDRRDKLVQSIEVGGTSYAPHSNPGQTLTRRSARRRQRLVRVALSATLACAAGWAAIFWQQQEDSAAQGKPALEAHAATSAIGVDRAAETTFEPVLGQVSPGEQALSAARSSPESAEESLTQKEQRSQRLTSGGVKGPRRTAKADCKVPYTIDAAGRKLFKPHCF
jgi:eukaryotic-like serine/threonine-protein kinase